MHSTYANKALIANLAGTFLANVGLNMKVEVPQKMAKIVDYVLPPIAPEQVAVLATNPEIFLNTMRGALFAGVTLGRWSAYPVNVSDVKISREGKYIVFEIEQHGIGGKYTKTPGMDDTTFAINAFLDFTDEAFKRIAQQLIDEAPEVAKKNNERLARELGPDTKSEVEKLLASIGAASTNISTPTACDESEIGSVVKKGIEELAARTGESTETIAGDISAQVCSSLQDLVDKLGLIPGIKDHPQYQSLSALVAAHKAKGVD